MTDLRADERSFFDAAEAAYLKASETSEPADWHNAGLLAKQHRNALRRLAEAGTQKALDLDKAALTEAGKALCKHSALFVDGFDGARTYSESARAGWRNEAIAAAECVVSAYLRAAPPAPSVAVKVKALEWQQHPDGETQRYEGVAAVGNNYAVFKAWWGQHHKWGWVGNGEFHETVDAAKAAAQSDYETRITSALITAPQDDVREALERELTRPCRKIVRARQTGGSTHLNKPTPSSPPLPPDEAAIRADEREKCAKVAESKYTDPNWHFAYHNASAAIAAAIRSQEAGR